MQQSNVIAACLFIAFIVFITMRGKLPQYMAALLGTNQAPAAAGADAPASAGEALNDPVGALAGAARRGLGIPNGVGSALSGIGSRLGGLLGF